ncbi:copper resistance protein CopC [Nocardia vinacea]|uniref:copper resistance CopC/CopD family protein n=1 Tax=Nocardia vinacea TaxID=96468 RepID=UPI00343EC5E8
MKRTDRTNVGRRIVIGLFGVLSVLVGPTATASAHAVLVGTDPAYGATVGAAPAQVSVTFDEPVTAADSGVTVVDVGGKRVDTGNVSSTDGGHTVGVRLASDLPDGTYLLSWAVLSADGHTVGGSSVFGIGVPPDLTLDGPPRDPVVAAADTVVRLLTAIGYMGVVLGVGVPATAWFVWRQGLRSRAVAQLTRVGALTIAVTASVIFAATPARLTGATGWADAAAWAEALYSTPGVTALIRAAAAAVLVLSWPRPKLVVPAACAVLVATAAAGHAIAGTAPALALVSTTVHLAAMSVWVGGVVLAVLVWRRPNRFELLTRFARVAIGAVAVLVITGTYQSFRSVTPAAVLWTTTWGRLLLLKLAVIVAVLAAAAFIRIHHRSAPTALRLELSLQIIVLVITATLTGVTPARDAFNPATSTTATVGPLRAEIVVDGAAAGKQELTIRLRDSTGEPIAASRLTARLTRRDNKIGPIDIAFRRVDPIELEPPYFVSQSLRVPLPGKWQLMLTVLVDRTTGYTATVPYRVW